MRAGGQAHLRPLTLTLSIVIAIAVIAIAVRSRERISCHGAARSQRYLAHELWAIQHLWLCLEFTCSPSRLLREDYL
jgi:hypothetical protein